MRILHTVPVFGRLVRFFRSPLPGEDLPWHAVEDLHLAFGLSSRMRANIQAGMRKDWPEALRTVTLGREQVLIAGHSIAQGLADALDDTPALPVGLHEHGQRFYAYVAAAKAANVVMDREDGLTPEQGLSRTIRAAMRGDSIHVH